MNWLRSLKQMLGTNELQSSNPRRTSRRSTLSLESLEERIVPYSVTGNAWPNPQLITISFVPDGTVVSTSGSNQVTSNLFSAFNNNPRLVNQWQNQILKAAQTLAAQTNINFAVVADNGSPEGSGSYEQGDPAMGDIRISGYNFGNSALAMAMQPPPANNYSIAGDFAFNTGQNFNINNTYDLYTVALHEFGHALGMDHSSAGTNAAMYPNYTGVKPGLSSDDIAGIRNIYSSNAPRSYDAYNGANNSFAAASNVNAVINSTSESGVVSNLNLATASQSEYFTFTAPSGTSNSMTVSVQSSGLSLLAPKVTVYAANQTTVLGSASGLGHDGTTLNVTINNVTPGQQYYVKVQGADSSVFGTGAYALIVNAGTGAAPTVAQPTTQMAATSNTQCGGGYAEAGNTDLLLSAIPTIDKISPDTGASSNDGVTKANRILMSGTAPILALPLLNSIQIHQVTYSNNTVASDKVVATVSALLGSWTWNNTGTALPDGTYTYYAVATSLLGSLLGGGTSLPSASFTVVIDTLAPAKPVISGVSETSSSSGQTLWINGSAEANGTVSVMLNGTVIGTTAADSHGNWTYGYQSSRFASGNYKFTATATDLAGNVSPVSATYNLQLGNGAQNLAAPMITASSIQSTDSDGSIDAIATPTFTGTAKAGTVVIVVDGDTILGTVVADSSGHWSFTSPKLASGTHNIAVFATDNLGNSGLLSSPLTIDI
jgi:hypothetical protein